MLIYLNALINLQIIELKKNLEKLHESSMVETVFLIAKPKYLILV